MLWGRCTLVTPLCGLLPIHSPKESGGSVHTGKLILTAGMHVHKQSVSHVEAIGQICSQSVSVEGTLSWHALQRQTAYCPQKHLFDSRCSPFSAFMGFHAWKNKQKPCLYFPVLNIYSRRYFGSMGMLTWQLRWQQGTVLPCVPKIQILSGIPSSLRKIAPGFPSPCAVSMRHGLCSWQMC